MKQIVWKDVLAEAEALGQTMFGYIAENTCSPGNLVVDENGEKVTQERWADALGMSKQAFGRHLRNARSGGTSTVHTDMAEVVRGARSRFRRAPVEVKAALVREAVEMYPEVAHAAQEAVQEAATATGKATDEYRLKVQREIGTDAQRVITALMEATAVLRRVLPQAQQARFGSRQQESLEREAQKLQAAMDLILQAAMSGSWDEELEQMVREA